MPYDHLSDFLERIEHDRDLVRIPVEVATDGELAEITRRISRRTDGGPAVLFERVRGSQFPVVTNLLGSERRLGLPFSLDSARDGLAQRFQELLGRVSRGSWFDALRSSDQLSYQPIPPRIIRAGPSQQVVRMGRDVNLEDLPVPSVRPAPFLPMLSGCQIYFEDVEAGVRHVRDLPVLFRGRGDCLLPWSPQDQAAEFVRRFLAENRQIPVAIAIGGDPAVTLAAACPLPADVDELVLAGGFRGRAVDLIPARSQTLHVPANAEFIVEGVVDPAAAWATVGPFLGPHGDVVDEIQTLVVQVTALTHRSKPVLTAMIDAAPYGECERLASAVSRMFLPLLQAAVPNLSNYHFPAGSRARGLLFVSVRQAAAGQSRRVLSALWGHPLFSTTRMIVLVDDDLDLADEAAVWNRVWTRCDPHRDLVLFDGPADVDDPTAKAVHSGLCRWAVDATRAVNMTPPGTLLMSETQDLVTARWAEYGLPPML